MELKSSWKQRNLLLTVLSNKISFLSREKSTQGVNLNERMKLIFLTFLLKDQCNAEKHADGIIVSLM